MRRDWWEQPSISKFIEKFNDNIHINVEQVRPDKKDSIQVANDELILFDKNEDVINGTNKTLFFMGIGFLIGCYLLVLSSGHEMHVSIYYISSLFIFMAVLQAVYTFTRPEKYIEFNRLTGTLTYFGSFYSRQKYTIDFDKINV